MTLENGRAVRVTGDPEAPAFDGYTCPKGHALPEQHYDASRLLRCMERGEDGVHRRIESSDAVTRVARKVQKTLAQHGPRSVATYSGTGPVSHPAGAPL